MNRYTAFVAWPKIAGLDPIEEVDVDAKDSIEAERLARAELTKDYEPGWRILNIEQRFGLYL